MLGLRVLGKTLRARTRGRLGVDMLRLGKVLVIMEGYICVADINSHKMAVFMWRMWRMQG